VNYRVSESVPGTGSTDIQFNDSQSLPDDLRRSITNNTHIAFAESQRSSQHGKALRIPGPREFEKGKPFCISINSHSPLTPLHR
jgi:hypothetical protein